MSKAFWTLVAAHVFAGVAVGTVIPVPASSAFVYSGIQASPGEAFSITATGTTNLASGSGGYQTNPDGVIVVAPEPGSGAQDFFTGQNPIGVVPVVGGVKFTSPGAGDAALPGATFGKLAAGFATTLTPTDFGPANFPAGLVAVGSNAQIAAPAGGGYLFFSVNDIGDLGVRPDNSGEYTANVLAAAYWDDDFATFAGGDLVGQMGWTQQGAPTSLPLQVAAGRLVMPGGQTSDNQDASKVLTVPGIAGTSAVYGMKIRVDSAPSATTPFYFAGLLGNNGFVNARIAVRQQAGGSYEMGIRATGQAGNPFQWRTGMVYGREYVVVVVYDFVGAATNNDIVSLYVNPLYDTRALNSATMQVQSVANGDMPACSALVISQFASATIVTPGLSISRIVTGDSFAAVQQALTARPSNQDAVWQNPGPCTTLCANVLQDYSYWLPGLPGINGRATFGSSAGALQSVSSTLADAQFGSMVVDNQSLILNATGRTVNVGGFLGIADSPAETASLTLTGGLLTLGVDGSGDALLGGAGAASGAITVDGPASLLSCHRLYVGRFGGAGSLTARNGAAIGASEGTVLGENGGSATALVESGASIDAGVLFVVDGTLTIQSGGELTTRGAQIMDTAVVSGAGSKLLSQTDGSFGADFHVGLGGSNSARIEIRDGGLVQVLHGNAFVGRESTGSSSALITGASSSWTNAGEFLVGDRSTASVIVETGAALDCNRLFVGRWGQGELIVRSGGVVTVSTEATFGEGATGDATVTVTGAGSELTCWGAKGGSRPCTVTINDGAVMRSGPNPPAYTWNDYIGVNTTGVVTIAGFGSRWENIASLWIGGIYGPDLDPVGSGGHGVLNILNGGSVSGRGPVYVGAGADAIDTGELVVGAGSSLSTTTATAVFVGTSAAPLASSVLLGQGGTINGAVSTAASGIVRGSLTIEPRIGAPPSPTATLLSGSGVLEPGEAGVSPFGVINVNGAGRTFGTSAATAPGTLRVDIGGTAPSQFDRLIFNGNFTAGGALEVSLVAYTPQLGDSWDIISAAAVSGTFSTVVGAGDLGGGKFLVVQYTPTAVRLLCVQINSVSITPASISIVQGFAAQLRAIAATTSGDTDITGQAMWSSLDGTVASVDARGFVRGQSVGMTTITATAGSFGASASVQVTALPPELRTERISLSASNMEIPGISDNPTLSADGRLVAFRTSVNNVAASDTNGRSDIFVRDTQTGSTTLVSARPDGAASTTSGSYVSAISPDGRYVAFTSDTSDLVATDTTDPFFTVDVFLRDLQTGTTEIVSLSSSGEQGTGFGSYYCAASSGATRIAFESYSTNLVAGDTNDDVDVFLRDRTASQTTRLSQSADGSVSGGFGPLYITPDGRYVVFASCEPLVPDDTNGFQDLYLRDLTLGTIERITVGTGGVQGNADSLGFWRNISDDGRRVVFQSNATNLVPNDTNNARDVFVRDRVLGTTTLVNTKPDGSPTSGGVGSVGISGDGRVAVWRGLGSDTVPMDTNGVNDVFVKDLFTGQIRRVSVSPFGDQGDGSSTATDISTDGRRVVFQSDSTNFAPFDTNQATDIFRRSVTVPIYAADINDSGTLSVQDIFDFLAAYFAGDLRADINGSGTLSVQDIFDFLAAYFGGL